jgi:hypothetical protein
MGSSFLEGQVEVMVVEQVAVVAQIGKALVHLSVVVTTLMYFQQTHPATTENHHQMHCLTHSQDAQTRQLANIPTSHLVTQCAALLTLVSVLLRTMHQRRRQAQIGPRPPGCLAAPQ